MGRVPDLVVGDLDSVSADGLAWAEANGAVIDRHAAAKDATDLELALQAGLASGADRLVVAGIGGGRFDHLLANVAVLADTRYADAAVDAHVGTATIAVVHSSRRLEGDPHELISLVPIHGDAEGVTTDGLGYPLTDATLRSASSRGVSNYFLDGEASVELSTGTLLAIQPERLLPSRDRSGPALAP